MLTDVLPDALTRTCGYSQCDQPLPYDGRGRPPEYCPDRRWPDGRTCKQLAGAERAAGRAAGLAGPLDTFRAAGDRLAAVASPLARQLAELVEAVTAVRDGALARVGEAERSAQLAGEQVRAEQERADLAQRGQRSAESAQRAAEADRDRARTAAVEAEQRAVAVRQHADEQTRLAWQRVAEADHARGQAEAAAAAAAEAQAEQAGRRELAEQRAAAAEAELRDALVGRDADRASLAGLRDQLAASYAAAEQAATAAASELARARTQTEAAQSERDGLRAEREAQRAEVARLTAERAELRQALAAAQQAGEAAARRAEAADHRLDQLIASLAPAPAATGRAPDAQIIATS